MRNIYFFILLSIIINIIGAQGKAKQKKKQIFVPSRNMKNTDYNYKNQVGIHQIEDNYTTISQVMPVEEERTFSDDIAKTTPMLKENEDDIEEEFIVKLSELQHAIVMTEVLGKPLALRKK